MIYELKLFNIMEFIWDFFTEKDMNIFIQLYYTVSDTKEITNIEWNNARNMYDRKIKIPKSDWLFDVYNRSDRDYHKTFLFVSSLIDLYEYFGFNNSVKMNLQC